MPDRTPGQIAYEAFWVLDLPNFRGDAWETMDPITQARWDAAAQAVLDAAEAHPRLEDAP